MRFTITTILATLATTAINGVTACEPDFFSVDVVQFTACATANQPGTDPAPMVAFMTNQLGCQKIINGDTNPLVGTISAHECHQSFDTTDQVPGFTGDSILLEPPCLPGDKCP